MLRRLFNKIFKPIQRVNLGFHLYRYGVFDIEEFCWFTGLKIPQKVQDVLYDDKSPILQNIMLSAILSNTMVAENTKHTGDNL